MSEFEDIKQHPNFCAAPWYSFYTNGFDSLRPCCVFQGTLGAVAGRSPDEIMDSEELVELRSKILKNDLPKPCIESCIKAEENGFTSHRNRMNTWYSDLKNGVTVEQMSERVAYLQYYDLRMSNLCNFKCHFCSFENSSSWFDDANHLPGEEVFYSDPVTGNHVPTKKKIWKATVDFEKLLSDNVEYLKYINISGGEPLLIPETYKLLESLQNHKKFDVVISISTNLSTIHLDKYNLLNQLRNFERVTLSASLDAFGQRAEYLRKGTNWGTIVSNWNSLKKFQREVNSKINLKVHTTVFNLNSFHALDFYDYIEKNFEPDGISLNPCSSPEIYNLDNIRPSMRRELISHYEARANPFFQPVLNQLKSINIDHFSEENFSHLRKIIFALDKIRNSNFHKALPEWRDYI